MGKKITSLILMVFLFVPKSAVANYWEFLPSSIRFYPVYDQERVPSWEESANGIFSLTFSYHGVEASVTATEDIAKNTEHSSCSANIVIPDASFTGTRLSWVMTGATTGSADDQVGTKTFNKGETIITYTATDAGNNTAEDTVKITISDLEPPKITLGNAIFDATDTGKCTASIAIPDANFSDNCPGSSLSWTMSGATPGTGNGQLDTKTFEKGVTTIIYSAKDAAGNIFSKELLVTISDTEKPIITHNGDQTSPNDPGLCGASIEVSATATDNCERVTPTGARSDGKALNDLYPVGTTAITWRVTDVNGNEAATLTQKVKVTDNEKPIITHNGDKTSANDPGLCGASIEVSATATDNCERVTPTGARSDGKALNDLYPVGTTTITWGVTDNSNNTQTVIQKITVGDTQNPTITAPSDIAGTTNTACTSTNVTLRSPEVADNCTATANLIITNDAPSPFPLGTTTVTWRVEDTAGNFETDTQLVTVTDNIEPTITAPSDTSGTTNTSCTSTNVTLGSPEVADNCTAKANLIITNDAPSPFPLGTTTVTWRVEDAAGNFKTDTQLVTVTDDVKPTISCVGNQTKSTDDGKCYYTVVGTEFDPTTTADNCGVASVSNNFNSTSTLAGAQLLDGTTIIWTVTDTSLNTETCSFTVTVNDTQAPTIPELPDLTGECPLTVTPPTTIDNCDGITTGTTGITDLTFYASESIFWVFTDAAGNNITVEQKVIIEDTTAPEPEIVGKLPPLSITGCQISSIDELKIPKATDACEGTIYGTLGEDFIFPYIFYGTNTITWTFVDSQGNITIQEQDIELIEADIDGGTLEGTFESSVYQDLIEITSCGEQISIELELTGQKGNIVGWEKLAVNKGVWESIPNSANDKTQTLTFDIGALESTYYRVRTQVGTCTEYSNAMYIRSLPPGPTPTIENLDPDNKYCLGEEVKLIATIPELATPGDAIPNSEGDFRPGQLNTTDPDSWRIDGEMGGFSSGGNSSHSRNWSGTNANGKKKHTFGDIKYDSQQDVFAVAQGNINKTTTLETPIMDLSNTVTATLDFDQAFYFAKNDIAIIEISIDGGATYSILRTMHAAGSKIKEWYTAGTAESVVGSTATEYNFSTDNTSISLQNYLGESRVRIRWSFTGTTDKSIWALDSISVNKNVSVEIGVEWTEGIGDPDDEPLKTGENKAEITITPTTPGIHQYGGTALINGCRTYDEDGTGLIDIYVTYSYAGEDIIYTSEECGKNTVQLNAYDNTITANENIAKGAFSEPILGCRKCDAPGTGDIGEWTWSGETPSCTAVFFSNPNDPDATFTAGPGTYTLTWTVDGCSNDITVSIADCNQVDFDGTDDYVDFNNNYDLNGAFSLEIWVKPESTEGTRTIFSKRDANFSGTAKGYDLSIKDGIVSFNWDKTGTIASPYQIDTDRWFHIALTHTASGEYKLYIDGVFIKLAGGGAPGVTTNKAILGAMDSNTTGTPLNYFNGWMEEFRIWNVALTSEQLRLMMNQHIKKSGTTNNKIEGEIIPLNVPNLDWDNLVGYYRMDNIGCGKLYPYKDGEIYLGIEGQLNNITSPQENTAPLPYESENAGTWHNRNSWDPNSNKYWTFPNDKGIDDQTDISWNIAIQKHDIYSYNKDVKLLGLFSESGTQLIMNGTNNDSGNELLITHYLKLNGHIDLNGESQLIQTEGSILAGSGSLERDQQGTASSFNYNYWSSPVVSSLSEGTYTIASVMMDGSNPEKTITLDIGPAGSVTYADGGFTSPRKISGRWLYSFLGKANEYSEWNYIGKDGLLSPGEGYTMKGTSGKDKAGEFTPISELQNYTFKGFPNNGTITVDSIKPNQNYLLGNPYPSAISVEEFILDNIKDGAGRNTNNLLNGAVYLWDHFGGNTHILREYVGGYAVRNILDGVPAISTDDRINSSGKSSTKRPGPYIAVAQGFFVNTTPDEQAGDIKDFGTGEIIFKNSQRSFSTETGKNSSMFLIQPTQGNKQKSKTNTKDSRYKIRLKFISPTGYHREISVGADARTTAGFDLGFDAPLIDQGPEDMYWVIGEGKYVIQGVPHFEVDQRLPLGIKTSKEGTFKITLDELENISEDFPIYLKDSLKNSYHNLQKMAFTDSILAGKHHNRYSIVFSIPDKDPDTPDTDEGGSETPDQGEEGPENPIHKAFEVHYLNGDKIINIKNPQLLEIHQIILFNLNGQKLKTFSNIPAKHLHEIPVTLQTNAVYMIHLKSEIGTKIIKFLVE